MGMLRKTKQFYQNNNRLVKSLCFIGLLLVVNQALADGDDTAVRTAFQKLNDGFNTSSNGFKDLLSDSGKKLIILCELAVGTVTYMMTKKPSVFLGLPIILIFTAAVFGMLG